jgi:Phosphate-selective porin O and P
MKTKYTNLIIATIFVSLFQNLQAQDNSVKTDSIKPIESLVKVLPKISGFINTRYQYTNAPFAAGKDGFDIRNARVDAQGKINSTINYRLQVDFAVAPQIVDAYAEWKPFNFIGLQVGQYKTPYTLENPYSPHTLETADNSQVVQALVTSTNGVKNNGRDIGLSINGNLFKQDGFNIVDYKLGVFNGNTINAFDDNSTRDLLATVFVNPFKPLSIGASYIQGKYGPEATKTDKSRKAIGAKYDDGKLLFRAEYIAGRTNNVDASGYYAVLGYFITKNIQPILKYDYYQSDLSKTTTPSTQYLVGVNYWIKDKTRLLVNYTYNDYKDPAKKAYGYVSTELIISF